MSKPKGQDRTSMLMGLMIAAIVVLSLAVVGFISFSAVPTGNGATTTTTVPTGTIPAGQVDLEMNLQHEIDQGAPAATTVDLYQWEGGSWIFWQSSDSDSGAVAFNTKGNPGSDYAYQVREAAPGSATYVTYTTPLVEFVCPVGDVNGDADIGTVYLYETSTSAATFSAEDQDGNTIDDDSADYVNTTDTEVEVKVSITEDCAYGTPSDFTDMRTGDSYKAGVWMVLSCTAEQEISGGSYYTSYTTPDYYVYVFWLPMIVHDADDGYTTIHSFIIRAPDGFTASADFDFDIYDTCKLSAEGTINANSWVNGDSDLNPTAVTSKVA